MCRHVPGEPEPARHVHYMVSDPFSMPHVHRKAVRWSALGFWVLAGTLAVAAGPKPAAEVIVNIDLTPEGRKVERPSAEKPAYYVPVILGYHTAGEIVAGDKPPARVEVIRQLGRALAKEGYVLQAVRPDANRTVPSLILVFE